MGVFTGGGLHTRLAASTLVCAHTHIKQQLHDKLNLLRLTRVTMETVARGEKEKRGATEWVLTISRLSTL